MPGPCKNCGAAIAPFGFRRRGRWSDLPANNRTMIFVCGAPDCLARAKEWKRKADGGDNLPRRPPSLPKPKEAPAQGSLF